MNTNYAAAGFLSLPALETMQAGNAVLKSSLNSIFKENKKSSFETLCSGSTAPGAIGAVPDKNMKEFLHDLQCVFKEQRDEKLNSITTDGDKKGNGQQSQNNAEQTDESIPSVPLKKRSCSINDFVKGSVSTCFLDTDPALAILSSSIPMHLQRALHSLSSVQTANTAGAAALPLNTDILFDIETLKLTLKITVAAEEVLRTGSGLLNPQSSARYSFDQSYMPYIYLLVFKAFHIKERFKKSKGRYSDSLYRKKRDDDEAQKNNHMSMLL